MKKKTKQKKNLRNNKTKSIFYKKLNLLQKNERKKCQQNPPPGEQNRISIPPSYPKEKFTY